jgi:nicotinamidase-related amidase
MNEPLVIDPRKTALVLIDLQKRILSIPVAPHSSAEVLARAVGLADRCREVGVPVVLVNVDFRTDGLDRLTVPVDLPMAASAPQPDGANIVPELGSHPSDIRVTKHQWGAFYGTDLDLQLRRRGIDTILLGGISTNFGVESTARSAWEHSYRVVFVEDAMAAMAAEAHAFAVTMIFPRIGRVRSYAQVIAALV